MRDLMDGEIDQISGGTCYHGVSNVQYLDYDGDGVTDAISFDYLYSTEERCPRWHEGATSLD